MELKTYKNLKDLCEYGPTKVLAFVMKLIQFPLELAVNPGLDMNWLGNLDQSS